MSKTNLLASACLTAIVLALILSTWLAIAAAPRVIRHAGCVSDRTDLAGLMLPPFKGSFGE